MKIKDPRGVLEKNYGKLWWIWRINESFRFAVSLLRDKWLKININRDGFLKIRRTVGFSPQLEETKSFLNSSEVFPEDTINLAKEFGFEDFWIPYLAAYIITGRIFAPPDKLSKDTPPPSVLQYHKIFLWRVREWADKDKLKRQGYRVRRRKVELKGKYFDDVEDLIHNDSNIADKVFGELEEVPSEKEDTKRSNRVKQSMERLKKYFVPLTPQTKRRLIKLFS